MCKGILFLFRFGSFMIFKVLTSHLSACLAIASKVSGFPVHVANAQAKPQRSSWENNNLPTPSEKMHGKTARNKGLAFFSYQQQTKHMWCPVTVSRLSSCDLGDSVGQQKVDEFDTYSLEPKLRPLHTELLQGTEHRRRLSSRLVNCWNTFFRHVVCKQGSTLDPHDRDWHII